VKLEHAHRTATVLPTSGGPSFPLKYDAGAARESLDAGGASEALGGDVTSTGHARPA
jgi:hypothetical protein